MLNYNESPIPLNPVLMPSANPANIIYAEPRLAPGGEGPKPGPPDIPPAVSAYTGHEVPPPCMTGPQRPPAGPQVAF